MKLPNVFPHQILITEEVIDIASLPSEIQSSIKDFNASYASAATAEDNGKLEDATVATLNKDSKLIVVELNDYLSEQEEKAEAQAAKDADAEAKASAVKAAEVAAAQEAADKAAAAQAAAAKAQADAAAAAEAAAKAAKAAERTGIGMF